MFHKQDHHLKQTWDTIYCTCMYKVWFLVMK